MDGMTDIEQLIAIEAIKKLKSRRDRAVDTKDWATYEALHAPDHKSHNDGFEAWNSAAEVVANTKAILDNRISVHQSHTPLIEFQSPTHATGIWGMEDYIVWKQGTEDHWLRGYGFYHESYERRDGNWVFTRRQLKRIRVETSVGAVMGAQHLAGRQTEGGAAQA